MRALHFVLIIILSMSCQDKEKGINKQSKSGRYFGNFSYGNFSDYIQFDIEQDADGYKVFFTSLKQNAFRIPFQSVVAKEDSISFELKSDNYLYTFKNKWTNNNTKLECILNVDSVNASFELEKGELNNIDIVRQEDVHFFSNSLKLNGTIWYPSSKNGKGIVLISSSGNENRSSSSAEAIWLAKIGYTVFHYDKRGTGNSQGKWKTATMEEILKDDVNAIKYFSKISRLSMSNIGIKGSSQGATKVPYILNKIDDLKFGIVVSCPASTLLDSDLNYWKNRNSKLFGANLEEALKVQKTVFEHIAGLVSIKELELLLQSKSQKPWFKNIWIPNLDEIKTDTKLLYSPMPYFKLVNQPILIIQGGLDEVIPTNSHKLIENSFSVSKNNNREVMLLKSASHSMHHIVESDFPYWSQIHPGYYEGIEKWLKEYE